MTSTTDRDQEFDSQFGWKYNCDQCKRKFANPTDLEYHFGAKNITTPETKVDCGECVKTFKI